MATLREFEYLVTVAETGTITAAATRLHVSQSALSQALASLERDLGGPLLHRDSRGITLTPAARAVLADARLALVAAERARRVARSVSGVHGGTLRLACAPSLVIGLLPDVLRAWRLTHAEVGIEVEEHSTHASGIEAVTSGRADLVIGAKPPGRNSFGLEVSSLGREETFVALAGDDVAAGAPLPDLQPLAERRWVCYRPGHPMELLLDRLALRAGFTPRAAIRVSDTAAAPALAAAGLGPALIPSTVLGGTGFSGALVRIGKGVFREIVAAHRVTDPLTMSFVKMLTEFGIPASPPAAGRTA